LTKRRRQLHALTGVRFFAAFWVVFHHTRAGSLSSGAGHKWFGNVLLNGNLAVPLFFILSGFILAYTYRDELKTWSGCGHFWQARFARIWPGYVFSLLVASLVLHDTPPPSFAAAALFMIQAWNPSHREYAGIWNSVCWTLSVEAFFYLVFPWMQVWIEKLQKWCLLIFIAGSVLLVITFNTATMGFGHTETFTFLRFFPYPVVLLPEFLLGVALGNLFRIGGSDNLFRTRGLVTYGGVFIVLGVVIFPAARWTSTAVIGFTLLVYGLAAERTLLSRLLSTRALVLGGGISYSIYLLQTSVRAIIMPLFADSTHAILSKTIMFPAALMLLSWITFRFIEEPARKFLRALFLRLDKNVYF
jgi:peptidoglycan/LPS O-acetylase OafA/YrhL